MKKLFYSTVFALLIVTLSSFTAQVATSVNQTSPVNSLRAHRQGSGVALSWSAASPDAVSFVIEKSYDGDFFDTLTEVNFNGGSSYKFVDNSVFPGVIYYRIKTVNTDGSVDCSTTESVRIVKH
jgi:hypothetical protein